MATDSIVGWSAKQAPLGTALRSILGQSRLTYFVRDEVVLVTPLEEANRWLFTAVYPADPQTLRRLTGTPGPVDEGQAIGRMRASIAPGTWEPAGGHGRMQSLSLGGVNLLVVTQTYAVQEQIAELTGWLGNCENAIAWQQPPVR